MHIRELIQLLDSILDPSSYRDYAPNGLQVQGSRDVKRLVTGVTAPTVEWSQAIHEAAREHHVTLLGGTHYSTEKFALMSLCPYFRNLGAEAEFIDETPDLAER